jgi:hypothetical protein
MSAIRLIEASAKALLSFYVGRNPRRTFPFSNGAYKSTQNTSSARRKMWGEDGNDARLIKLKRSY